MQLDAAAAITMGHERRARQQRQGQQEAAGRQGQQEQLALAETGLLDWSDTGIRLGSEWRTYASQPMLRRGDDGLSNRVLRLKALGNSIVPQAAAVPLARIKQLHTILY